MDRFLEVATEARFDYPPSVSGIVWTRVRRAASTVAAGFRARIGPEGRLSA